MPGHYRNAKKPHLVILTVRGCLAFSIRLGYVGKLPYSIQRRLCFIRYLSDLVDFFINRGNIGDLFCGLHWNVSQVYRRTTPGTFLAETCDDIPAEQTEQPDLTSSCRIRTLAGTLPSRPSHSSAQTGLLEGRGKWRESLSFFSPKMEIISPF